MKIELEVEDVTLLAKALNNAYVAYGDIAWSIILGCYVPSKFDSLQKLSQHELEARMNCLKDVYMQVEKMETR